MPSFCRRMIQWKGRSEDRKTILKCCWDTKKRIFEGCNQWWVFWKDMDIVIVIQLNTIRIHFSLRVRASWNQICVECYRSSFHIEDIAVDNDCKKSKKKNVIRSLSFLFKSESHRYEKNGYLKLTIHGFWKYYSVKYINIQSLSNIFQDVHILWN